MTTFEMLSEAQESGLSLTARGDRLAVAPNKLLTPDLSAKLREFKPALLPLLQTKGITWIEVHSERLGEDLLFCRDQDTKATLIEAGADPWSVYTRDELRILVAQNRVAPLSDAELRKVHEIKTNLRCEDCKIKQCRSSE